MDAELIVVGGKASKRTIKLKLPMVIGRGRHARLTIAHPMVSRKHTELFERDGLLMVRDLGSLNGTLLGGQRIQEAPLPPETEFTIGPLTFRAQYKYAGDLTKLPAPIMDAKGAAKATAKAAASPAKSSGDTEFPDFEAIVEAEILEPGQTPRNLEKTEKAEANQAVTVVTSAAAGVQKPSAKTSADKAEKKVEKNVAAKAGAAVEDRLDRTDPGQKPAKKPAADAFDELLNEFD